MGDFGFWIGGLYKKAQFRAETGLERGCLLVWVREHRISKHSCFINHAFDAPVEPTYITHVYPPIQTLHPTHKKMAEAKPPIKETTDHQRGPPEENTTRGHAKQPEPPETHICDVLQVPMLLILFEYVLVFPIHEGQIVRLLGAIGDKYHHDYPPTIKQPFRCQPAWSPYS